MRVKFQRGIAAASVFAAAVILANPGSTLFLTFQGGSPAHASFQAAAGATNLETFNFYAVGTQISSLPLLGIGFDEIAPGLYPGVYLHNVDNTPSLPLQLSNMPSGTPDPAYQSADIVINALAGMNLTAFGFWNGDPQGNMVAEAFDAIGNSLGQVSAATSGGFAGFVSDVAIARIHREGTTGDGYNHVDDFETASNDIQQIAEPGIAALFGLGLFSIAVRRRRAI